ncbi:hypothetical protein Taro_030731 [Colocasia esculenta]|uniref:Flotillin-like n=1 Tax=Colocasia esculenta TaxID=4460 RepID=A0A843VYS0_COLES|nr:hypothetical protein [Colocasia esculenta]
MQVGDEATHSISHIACKRMQGRRLAWQATPGRGMRVGVPVRWLQCSGEQPARALCRCDCRPSGATWVPVRCCLRIDRCRSHLAEETAARQEGEEAAVMVGSSKDTEARRLGGSSKDAEFLVANASEFLVITRYDIDDIKLAKKAWKLTVLLPAIFTIGPLIDDRNSLLRYSKLISPHDKLSNHIKELVKGVIEGETHVLAASMTMEEIFRGTKSFKEEVFKKV